MRTLVLVLLLSSLALFAQSPQYTADNQLLRPADYREWIYLSSGLGMTYGPLNANRSATQAFDNVFVTRAAYSHFLESGRWPDKTMFALEVRSSSQHGSINKDGHFQTGVRAVEILVRDEQRFPEKWGFFGFPAKNGEFPKTSKQFGKEAGCNACHKANGAVDGTFVQFYPTLLPIAQRKGTLRPDFKGLEPAEQ